MALATEQKREIAEKHAVSSNDVGSAPVQVALLTEKIKRLTTHLQQFKKDLHSQRGLTKMVGRRRKLLKYLARTNPSLHRQLLADLNLRG